MAARIAVMASIMTPNIFILPQSATSTFLFPYPFALLDFNPLSVAFYHFNFAHTFGWMSFKSCRSGSFELS